MDEPCVGASLNFDVLSAANSGMSQSSLVEKFCNDDGIFKRMMHARKVLDDEPAKQQLISKSLWYFADKTYEETKMIWEYVTEGRWKPDYKPESILSTVEVCLDDDDPGETVDAIPPADTLTGNGVTLRELLAKRLADLDELQ